MVMKHWKKQKKTKKYLNEIVNEKWGYKSKEQKSAITLYKLRKKKLFNNFSKVTSKYKSIHGEAYKVLPPKQMIQRLPNSCTSKTW